MSSVCSFFSEDEIISQKNKERKRINNFYVWQLYVNLQSYTKLIEKLRKLLIF